jgi:hypothetical protein
MKDLVRCSTEVWRSQIKLREQDQTARLKQCEISDSRRNASQIELDTRPLAEPDR